jgi:flagella synthesis protein FlgN
VSVRPEDIRAHLQRLLTDEAQQLAKLAALLAGESATLRGDDAEAIERVGTERHDCTTTLARIDAERRDLCRMLSYTGDGAGFERLLHSVDPAGAMRQQWVANLAAARKCKEHNDRNGAMVSVRLNHVQKLLQAIRGGTPPTVYSAQPSAFAVTATRELGRA